MSLQNYSCPKLGSLDAENMRAPGLSQMGLTKTRTYQNGVTKAVFALESLPKAMW